MNFPKFTSYKKVRGEDAVTTYDRRTMQGTEMNKERESKKKILDFKEKEKTN